MDLLSRSFAPTSLNEETRMLEVVFATENPVQRLDRSGAPYQEVLVIDSQSVDLSRLNSGAPLLRDHDSSTVQSVLGVVESARIEDKKVIGTVRFASDAEEYFQKVKDGILRNFSIGYRILDTEEDSTQETRTVKATRWSIHEVSLVSIPADMHAQARNFPTQENDKEIELLTTQIEIPPEINIEKIKQENRSYVKDVYHAVEKAGLTREIADQYIEQDLPLQYVYRKIIDIKAEEEKITPVTRAEITVESHDYTRSAIEEAILHRVDPSSPLTDNGSRYAGKSLLRLAEEFLHSRNLDTRGSAHSIATRAMSTSDFPMILANTANKRLAKEYQTIGQSFEPFVSRITVPDFKEQSVLQIGEVEGFDKVHDRVFEGAYNPRYKYAKEAQEKFRIQTYMMKLSFTREAIINDDLSAFDRVPKGIAKAVNDLETQLVYDQILENPDMGDQIPLFDQRHGNILRTGQEYDWHSGMGEKEAVKAFDRTMEELFILFQEQKDLAGRRIRLRPQHLIISHHLEAKARKFLEGSFSPAKLEDVSLYNGVLQIIVEPYLADYDRYAFFVSTSKEQTEGLVLATLSGMPRPTLDVEGMDHIHGMGYQATVLYDIGCKVLDYKAFARGHANSGNGKGFDKENK